MKSIPGSLRAKLISTVETAPRPSCSSNSMTSVNQRIFAALHMQNFKHFISYVSELYRKSAAESKGLPKAQERLTSIDAASG
jgi:hypothetical protein